MESRPTSTHILIVDNEPEAIDLLELVLRRDGHRLSKAESGEQALALLQAAQSSDDPVQLVLLDLMMPGMDGFEVLARIRAEPRSSRLLVMVVTAAYTPAQEVAGLEAGADDFIAKPFSPPQLLARIRTLLRTRRAEEALGRAEALSRLLIEGMRDMIFAADEHGHFTYVSPSAEPITGYTQAELTSGQLTLEWLVHPADHERVRTQLAAALDGASAGEIESRIIRKDGSLLWAAITIERMREAEGLQGVLRDVTTRHEAETALRARNQELSALNLLAHRIGESLDLQAMLADTLGTLMDVVDAEFGLIYTLDNGRLRVRAWHGLPASMLSQVESPDFVRQLHLHESQVRRERTQDNTGEMLPLAKSTDAQSWVSLPIRDSGQPVGLLVLASRDYHGFDPAAVDFLAAAGEQIGLGLRNAQLYEEAHRRASELALINEATHAASSTLNLETVLQTIMAQTIQVLQAEAGSVMLLEAASDDLVVAVSAGPGGQQLRGTRVPVASSIAGQAVREGRPLMVTDAQRDQRLYRAVDHLSGLTTHDLLAVPLQAHGKTIGVLEVMNKRDGEFSQADLALLEALAGPAATAIENARLYGEALLHAEEIQRSQQQLIHSEKLAATGRLAVSLAHEINNPLQAIRNLLFLTLEPQVGEAKRHEFLEMASDETSRLITLVQQTLEFYRPAQAQAGPVDINAAVERVLALARKKLAHNEVEVELALDSNLPPVVGMSDQFAQVFLNLIVNAAEAMQDGGKLRIETSVEDGHVQIVFADTGPGIAPEDLTHIFEPFYTTKDLGTGLGLAVSYNIIESHQGSISVASVPGHGATFTVRLPAAQPKTSKRGKRKARRDTR